MPKIALAILTSVLNATHSMYPTTTRIMSKASVNVFRKGMNMYMENTTMVS